MRSGALFGDPGRLHSHLVCDHQEVEVGPKLGQVVSGHRQLAGLGSRVRIHLCQDGDGAAEGGVVVQNWHTFPNNFLPGNRQKCAQSASDNG